MAQIRQQICFACGTEYTGVACPNCGYLYSIKDKCPRLSCGICQATKKFCTKTGSDYVGCDILLSD